MTDLTDRRFDDPAARHPTNTMPLSRVILLLFLAALVVALLTSLVGAQVFEAKLWQQDDQFEDAFGHTVCLAGGTAVVAEAGSDGSGLVTTYARVGPVWTQLTSFTAPDAAPGARFGDALCLDGDTLVVGAPFDAEHGADAGAVYVFEREHGAVGDPTDDRWTQTAKLYPTAPAVPAHFGSAVSLVDGWLIAGAPGAVWPLPKDVSGAAVVYVRDDQGTPGEPLDDVWLEQAWLAPASPLPNDFGAELLLLPGAHTALVGESVQGAFAQGSVRTIHRDDQGTPDPFDDTWADAGQISGRDVGASFGASLAFSGTTLLVGGGYMLPDPEFPVEFVGAYTLDDAGTPSDPTDDAWNPDGTLSDGMGSVYGGFGDVLALSEGPVTTRALVNMGDWIWGPPFHGGRVRVFERQGGAWVERLFVEAPDTGVKDGFGCSMALDGDVALIGAKGAPYVDDDPAVEGSAWAMDFATPGAWSTEGVSGSTLPAGAWGRLEQGATVALRLYGTWLAQRDVVLVLGPDAIWAAFKGGTMVPLPALLFPLVTGDNGDVMVWGTWPRDGVVPVGAEFWFQFWMPPLLSFEHWEASDALLATQP